MRHLSPGLEFYGGAGSVEGADQLNEHHYIFPGVCGALPHGVEYSLGPGLGLTRGSKHATMKFNLELERFAGALFGPASENRRFF